MVLLLGLALVNFFKIQLRGDPLYPVDIKNASEAGNILSNYSIELNWKVFVALFIVIGGTVFAFFLVRGKGPKWPVRVIGTCLLYTSRCV